MSGSSLLNNMWGFDRSSRQRPKRKKRNTVDEIKSDSDLLYEFVSRFAKYDKLRDRLFGRLRRAAEKAGIDVDDLLDKGDLNLKVDNAFCRCREIARIVKKDPDFMWC